MRNETGECRKKPGQELGQAGQMVHAYWKDLPKVICPQYTP